MLDKHQLEGIDRSEHGKLIDMLTSSFRSVEIAGKNVIQSPDGEFIEYVLMEEQYFVDNWLAQFAVGHVSDKNYFNHTGWGELTNQYTKGVIVLNEDKQPVVLIRKFIDMDLSFNAEMHMNEWTRKASDAKFVTDPRQVDKIISGLSEIITVITEQNPDYDTLTGMIPYEYYLSKGIDPVVVKQVVYIRDTYKYNGEPLEDNDEVMAKVEAILYKHQRGEGTTAAERDLITTITNGEFIFNSDGNKVDDPILPSAVEEEFDPLA